MDYGILLTGAERDLATLRALASTHAELVLARWRVASLARAGSEASLLTTDRLDRALAASLCAKGVAVSRFTEGDDGLRVVPALAPQLDVGQVWSLVARRDAASLVEAVRPVRVSGDPPGAEVVLRAGVAGGAAQRTIERLLTLGRDDLRVCELDSIEDGARVLMVRLLDAPRYLLMRAREEPEEGVRAYARVGDGELWVEWGYEHPLASTVSRLLKGSGRAGLVDGAGEWRFLSADTAWQSVYDAVVPRFEAARDAYERAPDGTRFSIRLGLGPGPVSDPELWLLDEEQFLALEPLIEALSPEEISRFVVTRVASVNARRYVLQELIRPSAPRLGSRVSDAVELAGYSRAVGTDNLYLPVGRQIQPRMRRDELRALLELDRARHVVVTEDADGPGVVLVRSGDEAPLARWIDYVVTDRRMELDRIEEAALFDWPPLSVEKPAKAEAEGRGGGDERGAKVPPPRVRPALAASERARAEPRPAAAEDAPVDLVDEATRAEISELEQRITRGGVDDRAVWQRLAELKERTGDVDDAGQCLEAQMFFGEPEVATAERLASLRATAADARGTDEDLVTLVTRERLLPAEASYLGARVLELALRGRSVVDESFFHKAERVFADQATPASRRLAWAVVRALHRRTGDKLGMTRARESIMGGINEAGLSESLDLPRFVRFGLALSDGDDAGSGRTRLEQVQTLESFWTIAQRDLVRELEPKGAYLRLIFAIGFMRVGAASRGRDLMAPLEAEEPVHEAPNRVLFQLYRARYAHEATRGAPEAWKAEVERVLSNVKEARLKDRVEWLRKRSEWLRTSAGEALGTGLKSAADRALAVAEQDPAEAASTLQAVCNDGALFDFELVICIERMLRVALRSGNDELLAGVLREAVRQIDRVKIPGHRVQAIGSCIRAAATLGDGATVDQLLEAVTVMVSAPSAPSARDLLGAVAPALSALRRLGAGASARRFVESLVPVAQRGQREGVKLRAALAEGFLQLRDVESADRLITESLDDTLNASLDHVGRYDAGVAVLGALKRFSMADRVPRCESVLVALDRFADAYTATAQRLYETHKVLIAERIIDAVVDDVTFRSDKVRAWLDDDEQCLRRKINADWRQACGR